MLKAAVPEIHVSTAAAAKDFYSGKLGFTCANSWRPDHTKDDPCYMAFVRDGVWLQVASFKGSSTWTRCRIKPGECASSQ